MKRYFVSLLVLTLALVLVSLVPLWLSQDYLKITSVLPLYFGIVTGILHYGVVSSAYKAPRTFIKNFLGLNLGSLFIHMIVLFAWSLTHVAYARHFILCFCICYIAYLVFETIALILFVKNKRQDNK